MKERPILFSGPMVRAIMEGRKTMTRRIVKPQPRSTDGKVALDLWEDGIVRKLIYGISGDRLWVRETWSETPTGIVFKADFTDFEATPLQWGGKWHPSIFMPRIASRILLEITNIRSEPLQNITEEDAKKEGSECGYFDSENKLVKVDEDTEILLGRCGSFRQGFEWIWKGINGPDSWDQNPWVWVIEFKRI